MAHGYRNYSPDQHYLLSPDPSEWLASDCLAYGVRDVVDELDLTGLHSAYSSDGRGAPAFAPKMMFCILLYGHYKAVWSSRGVKRLCAEDLGARYLAAGIVPDHRSVSLFRIRHKAVLRALFKQSVLLCRAAGMVGLKHAAVDGSKIAGFGSKDSSMTYAHIVEEDARLTAEIEAILQTGLDLDIAEDNEFGADNDGYSLPDHLKTRQDRAAALKKAKAELEARAKERATVRKEEWDQTAPKDRRHYKTPDPGTAVPEPDDRYNFSDPESRLMKGRRQFVQGYNAQACVDSSHQVIVACGVTNAGTDYAQLIPMAEQAAANLGQKPEQILADAGYFNHKNIAILEAAGFAALVPPDNKWRRDKTVATPLTEDEQEELTGRERMHHKVTTEQGRADYAQRMKTVEPVFGQIKGSPGQPRFTRFLRRGRERADEDWCFVCLGHNLRKLIKFRAKTKAQSDPTNSKPNGIRRASQRPNQAPKAANMAMQGI